MRGGKKMNEFYEAVSNLFEELRCDSGEIGGCAAVSVKLVRAGGKRQQKTENQQE